jgi:hypothetical protein
MEKYHEFLSHARQCEQLANSAATAEARQEWEKLARTWRALAGKRREMQQLSLEPEESGPLPTGRRRGFRE